MNMLYKYSLIFILVLSKFITSQPVYPVLFKELFQRDRELPRKIPEIKDVFVIEDCKHQGDNVPVAMPDLEITNEYGLMIWWNRANYNLQIYNGDLTNINKSYISTDDIQGIFDCTITIKLGPHDSRISYQEMMFGFVAKLDMKNSPFDKMPNNKPLLNPDNTLANKGLKELIAACKDAEGDCQYVGCIIIEYGDKIIRTCKGNIGNMGDNFKWFTRDNIRIRVLAIGSFIGKDRANKNLAINFPPYNVDLRLEFTRLYGGPCYNKNQFYCPTHGVCIKYLLSCDPRSMWNCPSYSFSPGFDEPSPCTADTSNNIPKPLNLPDPSAALNLQIFWIVLGIFLSLIAYLLLNYCLWRPGYLIWRCGRIRNWCAFGNCCYKACHDCSQSCNTPCCKTHGTFDTTETSTVVWSKFPIGDGFHMRENR